MKRRSKASGNLPKTRRRKGVAKRGKAPARDRRSSAVDQKVEIAQLERERDEALEQQAAAADVLKLISRATFDLQSVLHKVAESAARLCDADMAGITREYEGAFYYASIYNYPPQLHEFIRKLRHERSRGTVTGRALLEGKTIHVSDIRRDPEYTMRDFAQKAEFRTVLGVPLLRDGIAIGVIVLTRSQVRPFSENQIELVRTFATQAVIAIENARLLNELHQRTTDLAESLQQQTATSEILDVISNSPTDSQPAFEAIVRSGLKLFPDAAIMIGLLDGDVVRGAAIADADPAGAEALRARLPIPLSREFITSTAILDRREIDLPDVRKAPAELVAGARNFLASGYRAQTVVPMMRGETAIGTVNVVRRRPGPLSDRQRELLRIFANQAVIAIENTRLFNELRQRTDDLTESLEQQTATSEVLKVISSSQGELQPVFDAILANATQICEAEFGNLTLYDGEMFRRVALYNAPAAWAADLQRDPRRTREQAPLLYRLADTREIVHITDVVAEVPGENDPQIYGSS